LAAGSFPTVGARASNPPDRRDRLQFAARAIGFMGCFRHRAQVIAGIDRTGRIGAVTVRQRLPHFCDAHTLRRRYGADEIVDDPRRGNEDDLAFFQAAESRGMRFTS